MMALLPASPWEEGEGEKQGREREGGGGRGLNRRKEMRMFTCEQVSLRTGVKITTGS